MAYVNPKEILVDFLRVRLTDPRSTLTDDRSVENSNSETFAATAGQTVFTLTAPDVDGVSTSAGCVTSVTVDGNSQTKWGDYWWDGQNQTVTFNTALVGGESVVITYKHGSTNWIYPDKPHVRLNSKDFPRISVSLVGGSGEQLGNYEAPVLDSMRIQADVWAKEKSNNHVFTISEGGVSRVYSGEHLTDFLIFKIRQALEDYQSDMFPCLFHYVPVGLPIDLPFNREYQSHHKVIEFYLKTISAGEIGV